MARFETRHECQLVFPLIPSGLHCGMLLCVFGTHVTPVFPLIPSGLHCGAAASMASWIPSTSIPAHPERAPLRRNLAAALARRISVFPLIPSGLHCGHPEDWSARQVIKYSRSSRAGSIAAVSRRLSSRRAAPVFPLIPSGLHCGVHTTRNRHQVARVFPLIPSGLHCGGLLLSPVLL